MRRNKERDRAGDVLHTVSFSMRFCREKAAHASGGFPSAACRFCLRRRSRQNTAPASEQHGQRTGHNEREADAGLF